MAVLLKNPSLQPKLRNKIEAISHYYKIGRDKDLSYEYDIIETSTLDSVETRELPNDFNWQVYCELNPDVKASYNNESSVIQHYLSVSLLAPNFLSAWTLVPHMGFYLRLGLLTLGVYCL